MTQQQSQAQLQAAYSEAFALLKTGRAATAERQLRALQAAGPGEANSLHLLGAALLYQDKVTEAIQVLERAVAARPNFWQARTDLARAYRAAERREEAREELKRVVAAAPLLESAWLAYGDLLVELEKYPDALFAYERARLADPHARRIEQAREALSAEEHKTAEAIFRDVLRADPAHVAALCGLAAISLTASRPQDAVRLLKHAQKQSAHLPLTRRGLSQALLAQGALPEAESTIRGLLKMEGENPNNWMLLGTVYARLMRQEDALEAFEEAARLIPDEVRLRLSIGHANKTLGRRSECEQAYQRCLEMRPGFGEAYWSLADLKNYLFSDAEIAAMQALLKGEDGDDEDQAHLHFALGRAFEHKKDYPRAFEHYATGNRRRRKTVPFEIGSFENKTRRVRECFDPAFFASRAGTGYPDPSPIFIVGLPRSGSTLVEQILASHSCVDGTFELPNLLTIVREFDHADAVHDAYPEIVCTAPAEHLGNLGRRYIEETAPLRGARPHFIDKMPNNFSHVGLIQAILPRAVIVDVRRHPMDACFSTYKQHFAEGQSFSYDLEDLGRYYRCYLNLMDHWDEVLPGKVLRLQYEQLIREPEAQIRRLLMHCSLPFEPACLSFHETKRSVRTASAEQVRQPLYTSGVGYWRHFEAQLAPLRRALGESLDRFSEIE
jgi:tetratricopeptide (TPR) repeat protein